MSRILVFDSKPDHLQKVKAVLEASGLYVWTTSDPKEAHETIQKQFFHAIVWNADAVSDLSNVSEIKQVRPGIGVIVTSDSAAPSFIVAAMRAGATQFWHSTAPIDELLSQVNETIARTVPVSVTNEEVHFPFPEFIGRHPKILEIFQLILSIKDTDSTVLITGESGTGKEVVARAIHDLSPRKKQPLVAVNCGAIPQNLLESELFGHMKGAFTGASSNRVGRFQAVGSGTLFLDEITDLPLDLQGKLLRAIQNKTFEPVGSATSIRLDARIIAATNQDLERIVTEKRFREDLYYRLNVIPIYVPPLRNRKSDIPLLVKSFIDTFSEKHGRQVSGMTEEAMQCLMQYQWPGNIRELQNLMERVVVLKREAGLIDVKDLPIANFRDIRLDRFVANIALPDNGLDFNEAVNEFENELIIQALQKTSGNKNKAASLLNLNRTTLVEKLKRKGLRIAA